MSPGEWHCCVCVTSTSISHLTTILLTSQNIRVSVQNAALAVAEGWWDLVKRISIPTPSPSFQTRPDMVSQDLEWETPGLLKSTRFGPFGFEEKLLCLSSNLPSGFCLCFLKWVQFRRVGDEQGIYLCVVSASCVECVFSEDKEPLCWLSPGMATGWPTANSKQYVKAAMWSVICSAPELFSLRFLNLQATDWPVTAWFFMHHIADKSLAHPHIPPPL